MSGEVVHRRGNISPSTSSTSTNDRKSSVVSTNDRKSSIPINGRKFSRKEVTSKPDQPLHSAQDSLFSTSSGYTNYKGFFNLSMLLLVVSNIRVALENLMKYGILISPSSWFGIMSTDIWMWPNLAMVLCSNITCVIVLFTEKALANRWISNKLAVFWYISLFSVHVTLPVLISLFLESNPLFSFYALSIIVIETLKLVSYVHVNYWCRYARDHDEKSKDFLYPTNLTLKNLYYFMFAPTLCYELSFPKTPGRRKRFIIKRAVELVVFSFVYICLTQQWVFPLVRNSVSTLSDMPYGRRVERLLKLAIPNILIWLLFFYTVFHSFLNLLAEILCFADREFYRDFWNAETITYFWQTWNIPVHRWCVRHVYKPMVKNSFPRIQAATAVFLISAVFHEYLVSVPLKMFRLWAFGGMLMQIPLGIITGKILKGGRAGNVVVWLSLILGQPMAILMYVHDWYLINYPDYVPSNATEPYLGNVAESLLYSKWNNLFENRAFEFEFEDGFVEVSYITRSKILKTVDEESRGLRTSEILNLFVEEMSNISKKLQEFEKEKAIQNLDEKAKKRAQYSQIGKSKIPAKNRRNRPRATGLQFEDDEKDQESP